MLRLHEEMVAEGRLHGELVNAVPVGQRHESVTTASQTDLSGEVSCRHTFTHVLQFDRLFQAELALASSRHHLRYDDCMLNERKGKERKGRVFI